MRIILLSLLLASAVFTGCSTGKVCDGRGPIDICEIHHRVMRSEEVPNPHLKQPPSREYMEARLHYFVHSKPILYLLPDECKSCMVYICDDCVRAEAQWKASH